MFWAVVETRYCEEYEVRLLYGYYALAVDGSTVALPDMPKLLEAFGGTGRDANAPTARA
jgi:hypothetical protein